MTHVVSIVCTPRTVKPRRPQDHYARTPVDRVRLVERWGIEGDMKGGSTSRQLNIMLAETLAELGNEGFKVAPGEMGEQIVIAGIDPAAMVAGVHIKLGEAVIEVGIPRTGCARFEMIHGQSRERVKGRLGALATVIQNGEVAVGDMAEVLLTE